MAGKIIGTGSYVPGQVWDNHRLSQMVDTNDEWIRGRTGVAKRHIAGEGESTAYMAAQAAKKAISQAGIQPEEIGLILAATISPNEIMPNIACQVQKETGAVNAVCFDINSACTGFLFALNTAQAYLGQGLCRTALVVGAESLSNLINWKDRSTCVLFGDGAGAAVLTRREEGFYIQASHCVGEKGQALTCASRNQPKYEKDPRAPETYMEMDGKEVFKFAVKSVPEVIWEVLEKGKKKPEDVDFYILHQANARIVQSVAKRLGEDLEKFPMNIQEYGNTSGASIPLLLDELNRKGALKKGQTILFSAFGAGLSYGASLMTW